MRVVEGVVRVGGTLHRPSALYIRAFWKILVRVVRVKREKIRLTGGQSEAFFFIVRLLFVSDLGH